MGTRWRSTLPRSSPQSWARPDRQQLRASPEWWARPAVRAVPVIPASSSRYSPRNECELSLVKLVNDIRKVPPMSSIELRRTVPVDMVTPAPPGTARPPTRHGERRKRDALAVGELDGEPAVGHPATIVTSRLLSAHDRAELAQARCVVAEACDRNRNSVVGEARRVDRAMHESGERPARALLGAVGDRRGRRGALGGISAASARPMDPAAGLASWLVNTTIGDVVVGEERSARRTRRPRHRARPCGARSARRR